MKYRIGLNTAPLMNRTPPVRIHAKNYFLCVFYVAIWGQKFMMENRTQGFHSSQDLKIPILGLVYMLLKFLRKAHKNGAVHKISRSLKSYREHRKMVHSIEEIK